MPIYLEPNIEFAVCLEADVDKSPRPTFWVKTQSMRGQRQISDALDALFADDAKTADLFSRAIAEIERVLVRVENMPGFAPDLLSYSEARELLQKIMFNQSLDTDSKKD